MLELLRARPRTMVPENGTYMIRSYTMCIGGLPDIYILGPWASGTCITQTTHAHGITNKYALILVRISQ